MVVQGAIVRRVAVGEPSTNVVTSALTALAADAPLGGEHGSASHRLNAGSTMLADATLGALLVSTVGVAAPLVLAIALLVASEAAVHRLRS